MTTRIALVLAAASFFAASSAAAQSFPAGSGTLVAKAKYKVQGCDKVKFSGAVTYTLSATGEFVEDPLNPIVATAVPQGDGRTFTLTYDSANTAIINEILADVGSDFCNDTFTLTSSQITGTFKVNKRATRAVGRFGATFSGTTSSGTHAGSFKSKDKGPWVLAP